MSRTLVTGAAVERAVDLTAAALRSAPAEAWANQAGTMDCDCWDALDHISFSAHLGPSV